MSTLNQNVANLKLLTQEEANEFDAAPNPLVCSEGGFEAVDAEAVDASNNADNAAYTSGHDVNFIQTTVVLQVNNFYANPAEFPVAPERGPIITPFEPRQDRALAFEEVIEPEEAVESSRSGVDTSLILELLMSIFGNDLVKIIASLTLCASFSIVFNKEINNLFDGPAAPAVSDGNNHVLAFGTDGLRSEIVVGIDNIEYLNPFIDPTYKSKIEAAIRKFGNDFINVSGVKIVVTRGYNAREAIQGPDGIAYAIYTIKVEDPVTGKFVSKKRKVQLYGRNFTPVVK